MGHRRHDLAHRRADLPRHLLVVVFCPEHAQLLAGAGYSKADIQAWLIEHCGRTEADLAKAGKNGLNGVVRFAAPAAADAAPSSTAGHDFSRILPSPRHVPVIVAGARNAAISMVVRIFGEWSGTVSPVEQPAAVLASRGLAGTATRTGD